MKTKFAVTFTVTSDESLSAADKREFKALLAEKLERVKVRGFDMTTGFVKLVVPEAAVAATPTRKARTPKVEEEVAPARKARTPRAAKEEAAPARKTRAAKVVEEAAPARKPRAAKVVEEVKPTRKAKVASPKPKARSVRPAVDDADDDFDDE